MMLLSDYVRQAMAIADYRNLAWENPIPLEIPLANGEAFIVVVAHLEPNNVTLPFNVIWIVADPKSEHYQKVLRRYSAVAANGFRNSWTEIDTYEEMVAEPQFWDLSSGFNLGEVDAPQTGPATTDVRGFFKLNRDYADDAQAPVVVGDNDPRMSDDRDPLPHTHPKLPITMMLGATGLNAYHVKLSSAEPPKPGEIFMLTGKGAKDNEWVGKWRKPVRADLVYDGPTFDDIEILAPDGNIPETVKVAFKANAILSDGTVIKNIPATWAVIGNGAAGSINASTGEFQSLDVDGNQTVRIEARWTHPDSGTARVKYVDVVVEDKTVQVNLTKIEIAGPTSVDEGNSATYTVTAFFDNGTTLGVTPTTFTSSNPGAGSFTPATGKLTVGQLTSNQVTNIAATYKFKDVTKAATLEVKANDVTVYPESARIVGPDRVDENTTTNFSLEVTYTNGTKVNVTATDWASTNEQAGSINAATGVFDANDLTEDKQTTLTASYTLEGRTVNGSKQILVHDATIYPKSAEILGSAAVNEGTTNTYQFRVTYSNDSVQIVSVTNWLLDNPAVGTINATTGQLVAANDVAQDTTGTISASFASEGKTVQATKQVTIKDITNYPVSAQILGTAQMNENTTQTLRFAVTYLDGTVVNEPVSDWASSNTSAATIAAASGVVTAAVELNANQQTSITASFTKFGRKVTADFTLTVRDVTNYPVSAAIQGASTVNENSTSDYTLQVTFADGTSATRPATWSIDKPAAGSINTSGRLSTLEQSNGNLGATISAEYTLNGHKVSATKAITVLDTTVYPTTARIVGQNSVNGGSTATYQLEVTYSDASKAVVNVTNWASSDTSVGTIDPNTGVLTGLTNKGNKTTDISASYTAAGRTVGDTLTVTVTDVTNYPVSAAIEGLDAIDEGGATTYKLRVTFTDGSNAVVDATDWTSSKTNVAVINGTTGALTAAANLTANATTDLAASYTSEGTRVSASKTITVRDITVYPKSAVVNGPATVDSEKTATYEMRVTFEDNSTKAITADSWTSSNTAAGTIDSNGVFTAAQNKTGNNISTTLTAEYTLDGRKVTATKVIAVHDTTNYPSTVAVAGPNAVASSDASGAVKAQYTATVTYLDGSTKASTGGVWSIVTATQGDNVGSIDQNGVFTSNPTPSGATRNFTVRYVHTELGRDTTGNKSVQLTVVPYLQSLAITGAASVASDSTSQYVARATMSDSSGKNVTAAWSTTAASTVATINASTGVLTTKHLSADTNVDITAAYTENGISKSVTKTVKVLKAVELQTVTITGDNTMASAGSKQYAVTAAYTDGTTKTVTSNATYSNSNANAGAFDTTTKGLYKAKTVSANQSDTLTASYTENGITKSGTLAISVTYTAPTGDSLPRYGVAMFSDTDLTGGKTGNDPNYNKPYTRWSGVNDFVAKVMTNKMPTSNSGETFQFNIGQAQYGYFMHPASLGNYCEFTDQSNNVPGGMSGASWTPEGEIGESYDPIDITYDSGDGKGPQPWKFYRTDFDSLGVINFKVKYMTK